MFKKHHQNLCFFIRGACFYHEKVRTLDYKGVRTGILCGFEFYRTAIILNQHLFKVTSYRFPKWFYYLWCKHHLNEFIAIAQGHATTMGHIKRSDLESAIVLVPSGKELMMMDEHIDVLLRKVENNNRQLRTLIKVRNGLLPKLMNKEITIDE